MTKFEIATIGKEFHDNYYTKYHRRVVQTYKYRGQQKTREVIELTEEGRAIMMGEALNAEVFTCPCCGQKVSFNDLEYWGEDAEAVAADEITCSLCYEEEMGEDL